MLKRLFVFACLTSSAFCFEKGAELFENQKYLESARAFLTEAKKNDVRIPFYIRHLSEKALMNPHDLGEALEQEWNDRLQNHVPFAPIILGRGETYLQISLLAQKLLNLSAKDAESILQKIKTISNEQKIGYGYYVVGRFIEKQSNINKSLANQILSAYQMGAEYAHSLSILSLVDLPSKYQKLLPKLKINEMYFKESKVLSDPQFFIGEGEKALSRYYANGANNTYGKFPKSSSRTGIWQLKGAHLGDTEMQAVVANHNNVFQKALSINPFRNDEADRWSYFAALGGEPQGQALIGSHFYHGNNILFPKNKLWALQFCEKAIATFVQDQKMKNNALFKSALVIAGNLLDKGDDVPQNDEKAFKYYKLLADLFKDPLATFNVGSMLENGRGVLQDKMVGYDYLIKAFHLGDDEAAWLIGTRHLNGYDIYEKNPKKALIYLNMAAEKNNPKAHYDLFRIYGRHLTDMEEKDYPVAQDKPKALGYLKKASELGHAEAIKSAWLIGERYLYGSEDGYEKDLKLALIYLNLAADKGDPEALYDLYCIYGRHLTDTEAENYSVVQDDIKALEYLKKAAKAEHDKAQRKWIFKIIKQKNLSEDEAKLLIQCLERQSLQSPFMKAWFGIILRKGHLDIVPCDEERALKLLKEAGNEDEQIAFHTLGSIYERGDCGVEKNYDTARQYYERSQEIKQSVTNLGYFYEMGYGSLLKNGNKAIELYEKALKMGCGGAAYNLGALYQNGKFVEKNETEAFRYYQLGHELGEPEASYQYATYVYRGLCCEKDIQGAKDILLSLDPSSPDVAYNLAAIQWNDNETKSPSVFQRLAEEEMPLAQYTYGLLLYLANLEAKNSAQNMLKESKIFLEQAMKNGFEGASSALNLLINRSRIEKEEAKLIVKKLLKMDVEGARKVRQEFAQGRFDEIEQEVQVETSLKHTTEALAQRDPEIARMRQEQYLEYFTDPLNRKNVSVKGLYKIAASQASQQGGSIKTARGGGSGVKIKVGDKATGFHGRHRSGQSSNATLDPGRANSFRHFAEEITK